MKMVVVAGPPSAGKTALIKQIVRYFKDELKIAFLKIDVVKAYEDIELRKEFGIATKKYIPGISPDHAGIMVLGDAVDWAEGIGADLFIVESAGLCLRCSPYLNQGLGIVVLSSISGIHTPEKMGAMVSLADIVVVTKIDLVSQAEREVLIQKIQDVHSGLMLMETNALQGTLLERLYDIIYRSKDICKDELMLKGNPRLEPVLSVSGKRGRLAASFWGNKETGRRYGRLSV